MAIPQFTAEASLADSAARYVQFAGGDVLGSGLTPQAALWLGPRASPGSIFWTGCFVRCIQRSGGSDAGAIIETCALLCAMDPTIVF